MTCKAVRRGFLVLAACLSCWPLEGQSAVHITTPKEQLGFNLGDDYMVANYTQLEAYWKKLASESPRMKLVSIGKTGEGRDQWMAILSSPANIRNLEHYRQIAEKLARAEGVSEEQAHALAREGKAVVWIDGGLHASESVGSQQLMEWVYQMASRTDAETLRFLDDVIVLAVQANPDGQELIANWYMRRSEDPNAPLRDPEKRTLDNLPRLYNKYIGHDDNRDFYMSNMVETTNMNRVLSREWYPQIMYNHHQTGPAGAVIFMPPFRDPFNYNFDPLVPLGIELVGTAMHSRLVAEGKGGSTMRSGANYSTWFNGGLRTVTYFHNMIGILTEIIGSPTPMNIPLVADKQLPHSDWPMPIAPQAWHYRQSIDYEITNNRAIVDVASRYREVFLFNIWRMGMNSIERGSQDYWTITPKRIKALEDAAPEPAGRAGRGGRGAAGGDMPAAFTMGGLGARTLPSDLYAKVLHDPKMRDARGYVISADQPDPANATEFVDALIKNGIEILRATGPFTMADKNYPAGSYVIKAAQAFRPHIRDMFEPQDHPNDFRYPGGPPTPPYDVTGWTLAYQMGVQFDRVFEALPDGPFVKITGLEPPPRMTVSGAAGAAGFLLSHRVNNSFIVVNRLLKAGCDVYWLKREESAGRRNLGTGAIWVPASPTSTPIVERGAKELGVAAYGIAKAPSGEALKLRPTRIGLYDQYGGLMTSGWTRWLFEQYEFPFEVVYPPALQAGDLNTKFDVLVFPSRGGFGGQGPSPDSVPEEYRARIGRFGKDEDAAPLQRFVELGGSIVTIGNSTNMANWFGVPVKDYLTEMGADGRERPLPRDKFFIPGSLIEVSVDNTNPLAYGMPDRVDVFFDSSPVFKLEPTAEQKHTHPVAWFSGTEPLVSGWAWGQQYLDGGTAVAEAKVGEGLVVLLGPEVNFRDQPHATYKLLFNGLFCGSAQSATLP